MNELWLLVLAYLHNLVQWLTTHFGKRKVLEYHSTKKYFEKGDLVEDIKGRQGRVWRRYVKIKTGEPMGCSIMWLDSTNGDRVTPFVSAINKSPEFNSDGIRTTSY